MNKRFGILAGALVLTSLGASVLVAATAARMPPSPVPCFNRNATGNKPCAPPRMPPSPAPRAPR